MPDARASQPDEDEMTAMIAEWRGRGGQIQQIKVSKARRRPLPSPWDTIDIETRMSVLDARPPKRRPT